MNRNFISTIITLAMIFAASSAANAQNLEDSASAYAGYEDEIDDAHESYQNYFGVSDPNGADDTVYSISFSNGGNHYQDVSSISKRKSYTNLDAAQKIGYANDLCKNQVVYNTLKTKGVSLPADEEKRYERVRDKFCLLVQRAAKLQQRINQFNNIKDNGITLFQRYAKNKPKYNGYERTIQMGLQLQFFPFISNVCGSPDENQTMPMDFEYCANHMKSVASGFGTKGIDINKLEERFVYASWLQWSDGSRQPLNVVKRLREMKGSDTGSCGKIIPIKIIYGGHVTATLYLGVDSISGNQIKMKACAVFHYDGEDKWVNIGAVTFAAPFDYLGQLEAMRDNAQDKISGKVHNKIDARVLDLLGNKDKINSMIYTIDKMKALMVTIKQQAS